MLVSLVHVAKTQNKELKGPGTASRMCSHVSSFKTNFIRDFLVSNLPEQTKQPTQGWPNTASKHVKMLFLPFSLVILHCLRHVCCHDYLGCFLLKKYPYILLHICKKCISSFNKLLQHHLLQTGKYDTHHLPHLAPLSIYNTIIK